MHDPCKDSEAVSDVIVMLLLVSRLVYFCRNSLHACLSHIQMVQDKVTVVFSSIGLMSIVLVAERTTSFRKSEQ